MGNYTGRYRFSPETEAAIFIVIFLAVLARFFIRDYAFGAASNSQIITWAIVTVLFGLLIYFRYRERRQLQKRIDHINEMIELDIIKRSDKKP
jgi:hypothetical protein